MSNNNTDASKNTKRMTDSSKKISDIQLCSRQKKRT